MDPISPLPALDRATLTPLVRQALQSEAVEIVDWHTTPLNFQGGGSTWRSVYRVAGTGLDSGKVVTWSLCWSARPKRDYCSAISDRISPGTGCSAS
jgi:hypothetical protein